MEAQRDVETYVERCSADGVAANVKAKGKISETTLARLLELLGTKTDYDFHVEVVVYVGALAKTLDNEIDALETIRRLEAKETP